MTTDVPAAIATEIAAIAAAPEGERLTKMIGLARMRGASPDELLAAELAGIYMDPVAYRRFDNRLDTLFRNQSNLNFPPTATVIPELVIGDGLHAAVYCAIRHLAGFPKPYVLGDSETPGGVFAVTQNPSFFLNSEITGGLPGAPWDGAANTLNWVPGAPVQPGQLSARELADNTVMRYVIRTALSLHARVITRAKAAAIVPQLNRLRVNLEDGRVVTCRRVIDARGLGPDKPTGVSNPRVLTWTEAMRQADTDVPFADMAGGRVAILGGGKSAYCAAESILGIGPDTSMRTAAAGLPYRVDMYAVGRPYTREAWLEEVQTRYARLAAHLPARAGETDENGNRADPAAYGLHHDLYVLNETAVPVPVPGGVLINGRFYTHAVSCTGRTEPPDLLQTPGYYTPFTAGGRAAATKADYYQVFRVGPVADLPWASADYSSGITVNPENRVSMHRLTPLTAALAASLPLAVV